MPSKGHFLRMIDKTGILQFSILDEPDPQSGYTVDDNARALLVSLLMGEEGRNWANIFLDFMMGAQRQDGSWYNLYLDGIYYSWNDSDDCTGRAVLACCLAVNSNWPELARKAYYMLDKAWPLLRSLRSPRAMAYALTGLCMLNTGLPYERQRHELIDLLSNRLCRLYDLHHSHDWFWFEDYLTYCNGILPHSLFAAYQITGDKQILKVAYETLNFLNTILFRKGYLMIIGNEGWFHRGDSIPVFDQQPVDAASTALACCEAYKALGKNEYLELSQLAYSWYLGNNIHGLTLFNEKTGACHDALTATGINENQGSEALLSFMLSKLLIEKISVSEEGMEKIS